jgi:hypothetical protein
MSELTVGQLRGLPIHNNIVTVPSGHALYAPGHVVQVVTVDNLQRSSQGVSNGVVLNVSNMAATITPKSANSKILIQARWFGELSPNDMAWDSLFGISRNGTRIGLQTDGIGSTIMTGTAGASISYPVQKNADSTPENMSLFLSDQPNTTSPVTYQLTFLHSGTGTIFTNRTVGWSGQATGHELGTSGMMLMEIAQ